MADTCDTSAVVELSETSKSDSILANDVVETLPDGSTSRPESTLNELNAAAIPPQQFDAVPVPDSLDMAEPAVTDATLAFEQEENTGTFQSNAPETSSPIPETLKITEISQIAPNTDLSENLEVSDNLITENSEAKNMSVENETADRHTDATLENVTAENSNQSVTENSEPLASESANIHTEATMETLVSNQSVTDNSETLASESANTHTDATLETLAENSNPSVTENSEPSLVELAAVHVQTEMTAEEAGEKLDPTQNSKLTESTEHKECDLPESTENEISQLKDTEMCIDETPSTEITDAIKVKLEAEETAAQPTEILISEAGEQLTGSELETEPIVSSATPFIKSEINEAESEDVEMTEPQSETSAIAESQNNETSSVEINTEKDQTEGNQDEPMAQIQIEETAKWLPVNGDAPEESANEKDVEMGEEEEGDGERTVTMLDVLQEQKELEDNADAVLGASDDKNCTYSEGYIKRQALYACLTCCSDAKVDPTKRAGVCLACSLSCHENHDLIELYTKRNFRCDCGNPNFNSQPCTFTKDKSEFNVDNKYNQNFSGLYCICHRPYPDPESTVDDEMIQCVVCEDWLHASHLGATVPANDQYSEMICKSCMDENDFLHDYTCFVVNIEENEEVDVLNSPEKINGITDVSLDSSKQTQIDNSPLTEMAVAVNSAEKSRDETIDSITKESTDDRPVIVTTNEKSLNKTNDGDLSDRSVEMENSVTEAAHAEVTNNTSADEEAGKAVNNLTTIFESTESTINDDSTKVINDDESSKTLIEKTIEEIPTKDSTEENTSKDLIVETSEETTTQNATEDKMQDSSLENVIDQTAEQSPTQDDTEETVEDSSKNLTKETEEELLIKCDTAEKIDDSSNIHTNPEKLEETSEEIGDLTKVIEMSKKVEEKDKNADNEPVIVSENTIATKVETEDESKEISSEIAQPSDTGESVNENKISDENFEADTSTTDTSVVAENFERASANGEGLNTLSPNKSNTDDVESAADTQNKCDENAQKEVIPIHIEENTDKHSTLENSEQITNNINQDVEMAENDAATLPSETDTNAYAPETGDSEQLKPTQLVEAENIGTDVEMKDHTVNTLTNIDENLPQQQETDHSDVALPEANKGPNTLPENNEKQVAEQRDDTENTNKRKLSSGISEDNEHVKRTKLDNGTDENDGCKRPKYSGKRFKGATFWPCSWRKLLCSCHNCVSMYRDKEILFLLDLEDTVSAYEDLGKEKSDGQLSQYEKGLKALSSLDRIHQINALTEYNKMKDELLNFLISFKNRQEVVKVEDIEKFFADIKPKKKSDGVYFCR